MSSTTPAPPQPATPGEAVARSVASTSIVSASLGLAIRSARNLTRLPSAFIPSIVMPLFQVIAFSGTFFAVTRIPGFPTDRSINWYLPLAVLMGCSFSGLAAGFTAIRDLESGFYDRLRMSPAPRLSLITGPMLAAVVRAVLVVTVVLLVSLAFGARPTNWLAGIPALYFTGFATAVLGAGWGLGLAYRFRDMRAAAVMQLTLFLGLFLTDAQTPLSVMEGWLHTVARVNPLTNVLRLARVGFLDADVTWDRVWGGVLALVVLSALALLFARRQLDRLADS